MKISDYAKSGEGFYLAPEVQYACNYLERHGEVLHISFTIDNAVRKAAEMMCVFHDEDEDWQEFRRMLRSNEIQGDWT